MPITQTDTSEMDLDSDPGQNESSIPSEDPPQFDFLKSTLLKDFKKLSQQLNLLSQRTKAVEVKSGQRLEKIIEEISVLKESLAKYESQLVNNHKLTQTLEKQFNTFSHQTSAQETSLTQFIRETTQHLQDINKNFTKFTESTVDTERKLTQTLEQQLNRQIEEIQTIKEDVKNLKRDLYRLGNIEHQRVQEMEQVQRSVSVAGLNIKKLTDTITSAGEIPQFRYILRATDRFHELLYKSEANPEQGQVNLIEATILACDTFTELT